jgi:hypothetical protein
MEEKNFAGSFKWLEEERVFHFKKPPTKKEMLDAIAETEKLAQENATYVDKVITDFE